MTTKVEPISPQTDDLFRSPLTEAQQSRLNKFRNLLHHLAPNSMLTLSFVQVLMGYGLHMNFSELELSNYLVEWQAHPLPEQERQQLRRASTLSHIPGVEYVGFQHADGALTPEMMGKFAAFLITKKPKPHDLRFTRIFGGMLFLPLTMLVSVCQNSALKLVEEVVQAMEIRWLLCVMRKNSARIPISLLLSCIWLLAFHSFYTTIFSTDAENAEYSSPVPPPPVLINGTWNSTGLQCKGTFTVMEGIGPGILLTIYCCTIASFIFSKKLYIADLEDCGHARIHQSLGGLGCQLELRRSESESEKSTVVALIQDIIEKSQQDLRKYKKQKIIHRLISLLTPLPYVFIPFISRHDFGCVVFWHWHYVVNKNIYFAAALNYLLSYWFIHTLCFAYYLFGEQYRIRLLMIKLVPTTGNGFPKLTMTAQNARAWFCIETVFASYKARLRKKFNTIISGLAGIVVSYCGFYYASFFMGWTTNINGYNMLYLSAYTVTLGGCYLMFPILKFGAEINRNRANTIAGMEDASWYFKIKGDDQEQAADIWASCAEVLRERRSPFSVLGVPITYSLLKSVGLLTVTTLSSAVTEWARTNVGPQSEN